MVWRHNVQIWFCCREDEAVSLMVDNGRRWRRDDSDQISSELRCCGGCGNGGLETGLLLRRNG